MSTEEQILLRARIYLRSKYREYLWHSTVAHFTKYDSIRERRSLQADNARHDASRAYWIITGDCGCRSCAGVNG